ncbi:MAG: HEAT repeat domain-containing protein [Planctomycetes bacterium]|nr:HEAT repeat domain-containing protein [Planctomycetota bacterium]
MANTNDLNKWRAGLRATFPLVGALRRKQAMDALEAQRNDPDVVPLLVEALGLSDAVIAGRAATALADLTDQTAVDALCDEAIKNPRGEAAKLCLRTGKRPSDPQRLCLFLFVTALLDRRQLDEYFQEDYEFQNLRLELDRADPVVRGHVMEVYRSGDRRVQGLIPAQPKTLEQLSDKERQMFQESCVRHQDWKRLFDACLKWPVKYSAPALAMLRQSRWEPESPDLKSVYRKIVADAGGLALPPPKKPSAASSLFEQWLARGASGARADEPEAALCERLNAAGPAEAVGIVGALAAHKPVSEAAAKAIRESPHWLVRLAGHAVGIAGTDVIDDSVRDPNYWVTELASAASVLDFWPGKDTPADLAASDALASAPPEAFTGGLGAARCILNTILQHQNIAIQVGDIVVRPDEYEVIVEDA